MKTIPKILNGKYYSIQKNEDGNIEAMCNNCDEVKKGNISSTGNFRTHIKKKHPSLLSQLDEYLNDINSQEKTKKLRQPMLNELNNSNDNVSFF